VQEVQRRLSPDWNGNAWRQDERTNEPGDHGQAGKNHRYQAFAVCAIGTLAIALVAHASPAAAHSAPRDDLPESLVAGHGPLSESKSNDVSFVFTGANRRNPDRLWPWLPPITSHGRLGVQGRTAPFQAAERMTDEQPCAYCAEPTTFATEVQPARQGAGSSDFFLRSLQPPHVDYLAAPRARTAAWRPPAGKLPIGPATQTLKGIPNIDHLFRTVAGDPV
jgi:hypothetical protein